MELWGGEPSGNRFTGNRRDNLIMRLADRLNGVNAAGFYTEEIRKGGAREGFTIVDLRGTRTLLSHVDIREGQG